MGEQKVVATQTLPGSAGGRPVMRGCILESLPQYEAPRVEESWRVSEPPAGPALGSSELPSAGSAGHAAGRCKPCAFVHTKGCENGIMCEFCHLCEPGEKKRRHKEKLSNR